MNELANLRAYYYEFIAFTLFFTTDKSKFQRWQKQLYYLSKEPITKEDRAAFENLEKMSFEEFMQEQNELFFDFSFANVPLSASFYLEGRDEGEAKLKVINILRKTKFRRDESSCKDSEDFIGFIFMFMAKLLNLNEQELAQELFKTIINEFEGEFCYLLKTHKRAHYFQSVANIFDSFMQLERSVYGVSKQEMKHIAAESLAKKPYISKIETFDID